MGKETSQLYTHSKILVECTHWMEEFSFCDKLSEVNNVRQLHLNLPTIQTVPKGQITSSIVIANVFNAPSDYDLRYDRARRPALTDDVKITVDQPIFRVTMSNDGDEIVIETPVRMRADHENAIIRELNMWARLAVSHHCDYAKMCSIATVSKFLSIGVAGARSCKPVTNLIGTKVAVVLEPVQSDIVTMMTSEVEDSSKEYRLIHGYHHTVARIILGADSSVEPVVIVPERT